MKCCSPTVSPLTRKELKDLKVLGGFTRFFCQAHHDGPLKVLDSGDPRLAKLKLERYPLCPECLDLLGYAIERRLRCPLNPKPTCKHCEVHCFRPGHREKVREIMRFSGKNLLKRGRLDLLWHYFF